MFMSISKQTFHTMDNPTGKIEVRLMDDTEFAGISEFRDFPIMAVVDKTIYYFRKAEAESLAAQFNSCLQELDRQEIERRLA